MIYGNIFAVPSKTHQSIDGKKRNLNRTVSFPIKNLLDLLVVWFRIHTIFSAVKPLCVGDEPCFMTSLNFIDMLWTNIKLCRHKLWIHISCLLFESLTSDEIRISNKLQLEIQKLEQSYKQILKSNPTSTNSSYCIFLWVLASFSKNQIQ